MTPVRCTPARLARPRLTPVRLIPARPHASQLTPAHGCAFATALLIVVALAGCASSRAQLLAADESQVQLRSIQTRAFDTTDRVAMLRSVMATLQDLDFVIDHADDVLGTVTATKLDRYRLRMTVTVRPRGATQLLVRATAQYNLRPVEDPAPYQRFFAALSRGMFLEAHQVD